MKNLVLPLPQSPEFARAAKLLDLPIRTVSRKRDGEVSLLWQVQSRRFGPLGRVDLISRGPVGRSPEDVADWTQGLHRWQDRRPLLLNADGLGADALRAAGFWPLLTPSSLALLPLADSKTMRQRMDQKWRNRLNRAEGRKVSVTRKRLSDHHWLLEADATQARMRGYRGLPPSVALAFAKANPGQALVWEAQLASEPVAALLVLRHGPMVTWQTGHSTDKGRACNAMNLLLWRAMVWLGAQGHRVLDLGALNTEDAPGLARFKLGTGAQMHRLGGSWLHLGALAPLARHLPQRLAA